MIGVNTSTFNIQCSLFNIHFLHDLIFIILFILFPWILRLSTANNLIATKTPTI